MLLGSSSSFSIYLHNGDRISFCRIEKVEMMYWYSRAKILGTLLCLGGAVAMSLLQSPSVPPPESPQRLHPFGENLLENTYKDWFIGCLCLFGAVLVISCTMVLQVNSTFK